MANKKVTLDVAVKADDKEVDVLEQKLKSAKQRANELKQQKIQMKIDADSSKLEEVRAKADQLRAELQSTFNHAYMTHTDVDMEKVHELQAQIEELDGKAISLEANIEKGKVDALQGQIENMNGKTVTVNTATDNSGLEGMQNKLVGIAGTIGMVDQATQMWEAATARQGQQFYLSANMGAEKAREMQSEIQKIVAQVPGDDTFMNQLMTTALAQNTQMTTKELKELADVSADYMAASNMMGKMPLEAQQDIYKYILDGNTAELERGSILSSQVDKLKDQATIQDRIKAVNEAMQQMGFKGMSGYDTAANNLEEFKGRLEKARADWGTAFLPLEQGALKAAMALDDKYGGALMMAITGTQALVPTIVSGVSAFGEFHRGMEALKDTKLGEWAGTVKNKITGIGSSIRNVNASGKFDSLKSSLSGVATSAKSTAVSLGTNLKSAVVTVGSAMKTAALSAVNLGRSVLTAGYNALKTVAMWIAEKVQIVASTVAKYAAAAASMALGVAEWFAASPILIVVAAVVALIAILWYLYNTNESVRNAIDGFIAALWNLGGTISGALTGAFAWLQGAWQNTVDFFTNGASTISDTVGGAFTWLSEGLQWFADIITGSVMGAVQWLTDGLQWLSDLINGSIIVAVQWLSDLFTGLGNGFQVASDTIMTYAPLIAQILFVMATGGVGAIVLLIANFMGMPNQVGGALQNVIGRVMSFVGSIVSNLSNGARNAVQGFVSGLSNLAGSVYNELQRTLDRVMEWGGQIVSRLGSIAQQAWQAFVSGLGIGSPGYIQILTLKELADTGYRIPNVASGIVSNLSSMADKAVNAWGTPVFDYSFQNKGITNNNGSVTNDGLTNNSKLELLLSEIVNLLKSNRNGNTMNFTLNGDMDNEERMQNFVDEIIRQLKWDNDTAGRTIETL